MQKDYKSAEAQYRKVLQGNPEDMEVRADLGDLMMLKGNIDQAEKEYSAIRKHAPNHPLGYIKMSSIYMARKKWDRAISELEQVVRMHPDHWSVTNDRAYRLSEYGDRNKDLGRALVLVEKANSLSPDNPAVFDTLGWVYYQKGEVNKAIEWLGKAQNGNAGNPVVNFHLGMAYNRAGNSEKAKEYLEHALASRVSFPGKDEAEKTMAGIH